MDVRFDDFMADDLAVARRVHDLAGDDLTPDAERSMADYLAGQPYVDPERVYLGGHSTGGTLVMLVAASSDRSRAMFSFGPVEDVSGYGSEY